MAQMSQFSSHEQGPNNRHLKWNHLAAFLQMVHVTFLCLNTLFI